MTAGNDHALLIIRPARPEDAATVSEIVMAAYQRHVPVIGRPPGPMNDDYDTRIAAGQVWVLEDSVCPSHAESPKTDKKTRKQRIRICRGFNQNRTESSGRIDGILVLENGPDHFLLDNIAIRPDRQGDGLGRALLDFAEAEATRTGWSRITLYTHALMTENRVIYAGRGYREIARRCEKGFDRVYMEKNLSFGG